jgi:cell division transport system permease protein
MAFIHIKRMARTGFLNFSRNGIVSLASVLVMTIALSVLTGILLSEHVFKTTLTTIENKVDVTVYITPGADENTILGLKNQVEALPEVAHVDYTSERQALADFRVRHASDQTTLQALDELDQNPIGATLNVKAKDISQYETISKFFDTSSGTLDVGTRSIVDHADYNNNKSAIDAIEALMKKGRMLGIAITLVLMALSVIVTFNTMRLAIYFAREEISVMRLVGASKTHIQGPFIVEGALYGIVATIVTLFLFLPICWWLGAHMTDFFGGLNLFTYYLNNTLDFVLILLIFGIGLGALSSVLAVRKYLSI